LAIDLVDGIRLYRWLFAVAIGVSLGGVGIALVSVALTHRWRRRGAAFAPPIPVWILGGTGAASLVWALLVTYDGSPIHRFTFENAEFLRDLRFIALYGAAFGLGLAIAVALVGASLGTQRLRIPRPAKSALVLTPAATLAVSVVALVSVVGAVTSDSGRVHPQDARSVDPVGAVGIGSAAFATGLVVAPTGDVFFAESATGRIGVLSPQPNGEYQASTFGTIELPEAGQLFHLELHPGWPEQPYLYATAQHDEGEAQRLGVLLLEASGLTMLRAERLVSGLPTEDPRRGAGGDHYGSGLAACGEYLYVSVGDTDSDGPGSYRSGFVRGRAQLASTAEGKVLRYRIVGAELEPAGVLAADPPVYAMGLRNPFDMTCTADDEPIVVDNGPIGHDQVRLIGAGSNHEWPFSDDRRVLASPLWDSGLSQLGPTGIASRVTPAGEEILVGSFHLNAVYRLSAEPDRVAAAGVEVLHEGPSPLLAIAAGPDGCLYLADVSEIRVLAEDGCAAASSAASAAPATSFDGPVASIYAQSCSSCHGTRREGGVGPALTSATLTGADDGYIATILGGRPGTAMPAWGELGLTAEQARALLDFLRSD
jgi:cytochrome c55X